MLEKLWALFAVSGIWLDCEAREEFPAPLPATLGTVYQYDCRWRNCQAFMESLCF